jgi:hypothetical protein
MDIFPFKVSVACNVFSRFFSYHAGLNGNGLANKLIPQSILDGVHLIEAH